MQGTVIDIRPNSVNVDLSKMKNADELGYENNVTVINHKNYEIIQKAEAVSPSTGKHLNLSWRKI
ncbi:DUF2187 domain-containing protein [Bacillus lacus]|uniref:DUF2187 domain-containing protein n=1 Tax=Metabacillus lacus TaxID=1983721 RepID=A0A7X2J2M7_9BACI|nr:DUF2187 domain-containing protein [Metabacillus lacus]